jgi:hypothetical protein
MAKKQIKNRKKISLSEGFLDGEEELTQTAEEVTPELPPEDDPDNVVPNDDTDPDVDPAEEPGTDDTVPEEGGEEETGVEETGVEGGEEETAKDTLDAIQTLTTAVQELTQKIDDMNAAQQPAEEPIEAEPSLEEPPADDDGFAEEGGEETSSEETSEEGGSEEGGEGGEEGGEESGTSEEDFSGSEDGSSEESSEEEGTTSESLIKAFTEPGMALNEDSPYMIGKIYQNRFDKLEPIIMGIVKTKLRNRIDGARTEFRAQAFKETYGE